MGAGTGRRQRGRVQGGSVTDTIGALMPLAMVVWPWMILLAIERPFCPRCRRWKARTLVFGASGAGCVFVCKRCEK
jgi:hypothetical protein